MLSTTPAAAASHALHPHASSTNTNTNINNINKNNSLGPLLAMAYPVKTLYCPPVPPSMLMGRYRPPPRPGRRYKNDLALAGPVEHWAATQISKMWRGVLTRRHLRNARNFHEVRTRRATMIQCWWRQLRARWRRRRLSEIRQEWINERRARMVSDRLKGYGIMMTWQRKRFEDAVIKVQRVYRWYRSTRQNAFMPNEETAAEVLPFPLEYRRKVYFPWRKTSSTITSKKGNEFAITGGDSKSSNEEEPKTSLQFRKTRKEPVPPTIEEAKVINDKMRAREAQRANELAQPEVQDRLQWKRDGLRENDFDHNAGMIQRLVKYKWDGWEKITRKVTSDYFNDKVRIIQRSFRLFQTQRRMKRRHLGIENRSALKNESYAREKISRLEEDAAWQTQLLNNAAQTIQMMWTRYKYRKQQCDPFMEIDEPKSTAKSSEEEEEEKQEDTTNTNIAETTTTPPPPPPYNLLTEHITRERAVRDAARSRMEKEMEAARKRIRRSSKRYVPDEIEVVSGEGVFLIPEGANKEKDEEEEERKSVASFVDN